MKTGEFSKRTGLTFRQIEYCRTNGVLKTANPEAKGTGIHKEWTETEVLVGQRLADLYKMLYYSPVRLVFLEECANTIREAIKNNKNHAYIAYNGVMFLFEI